MIMKFSPVAMGFLSLYAINGISCMICGVVYYFVSANLYYIREDSFRSGPTHTKLDKT